MNILAIDTSNRPMSVALYHNETPLIEHTLNSKRNHSVQLMPAIDYIMKEVNIQPKDLSKIIVANGPGSYTGLRIGVTTAKTLAWTLNIPLVTVSSLELVAANLIYSSGLICSFFDARRGNVFTGLYRAQEGRLTEELPDQNIAMEEWLDRLNDFGEPITMVSPTEHSFTDLVYEILGKRAKWVTGHLSFPQAGQLVLLGKDREPVDIHTTSPQYHRLVEAEVKWMEKNERN
uniref:tRNA (adenosine(37)-N6)-threonylcarbamoyltransferase complex dimerization subunit type 1 TsaB n=1 Tax=uncultured Allobacillus sp. TaxID=1638025 RepID=UPI00259A7F37|nr:tRNA (adenosine(37)-N6)-threonylcarbamoyltransferase complex dimerization subunit type 1 TsaB [uncultured Allobacillus sp.]